MRVPVTNLMADSDFKSCPVKASLLMMTSAHRQRWGLEEWVASNMGEEPFSRFHDTRDWTVRFLSLIRMPRQAGRRAGWRESEVLAGGVTGADGEAMPGPQALPGGLSPQPGKTLLTRKGSATPHNTDVTQSEYLESKGNTKQDLNDCG